MMRWPPILRHEKRLGNRPGLGPLRFCRRSFLEKTMFWASGMWTAGCARPSASGSALLSVKSAREFRRAVLKAEPGAIIEAADGDYAFDESPLLVSVQGEEDRPIVIRAQNRGKARLTGRFGFHVRGAAHLLIEGFDFQTRTDHLKTVGEIGWAAVDYEIRGFPRKASFYSTLSALLVEDSRFVRIARNRFHLNESQADRETYVNWVNITGPECRCNRVDHNLFEEKFQSGVFVATSGGSRLNRIDHNYFRKTASFLERDPKVEVTAVALRRSYLGSPASVVDHNLFEYCDGDSEIIEIKGGDNSVVSNTFRNCMGGVSLRSGHRTLVQGNFFLNPSGRPYAAGVRMHGYDQKVVDNYFDGLIGDSERGDDPDFPTAPPWYAPIGMIGGDTELELGLQGGDYRRVDNALVAFNTFVNCWGPVIAIYIDPRRPLSPRNTLFANNVVTGSTGRLVWQAVRRQGVRWAGNILHHDGGIEKLGISADGSSVRFIDPKLVYREGIWRPSPESPVIGAAVSVGKVMPDSDGKFSEHRADAGFGVGPTGRLGQPLLPGDVGAATGRDEPVPVDWANAVKPFRAVNFNHRVQKFDAGGRFLSQWGREGVGAGELSVPLALSVASDGAIYISEYGNERVQKFSPEGESQTQWGGIGREPGEFRGPSGIAVGPRGDVWVVDKFNSRIQRFNSSGAHLEMWGSRGQDRHQFDFPAALAFDREGNVLVVDPTRCRVQKFTAQGNLLAVWGGCGSGGGRFHSPGAIALDGQGNHYVSDTLNDRVQKFSPEGRLLTTWGEAGSAEGRFRGPSGIAVDRRDHVYVVDSGNDRIQIFRSDGSFLHEWGITGSGPGEFRSPVGIAVGPDGSVYVTEVHRERQFLE